MSKESIALQLRELRPNPMGQLMEDLEAKNAEVGGMLFSTFGRGEHKAFVFPTSTIGGIRDIYEFLAVTQAGFKLIQIKNSQGRIESSQDRTSKALNIIRERLGKMGSGSLSDDSGYSDGTLRLGGSLVIAPKRTEGNSVKPLAGASSERTEPELYDNCRLVDGDEGKVEDIFRANMKRVKAMQAAAQRVNKLLG